MLQIIFTVKLLGVVYTSSKESDIS